MADKLKIYACSGLDQKTQAGSGYKYWTDGYNTLDNTQAVNSLLAKINLCRSEIKNLRNMTAQERIASYNNLVLYAVCLQFAREYADDKAALQKAGAALAVLFTKGQFAQYDLSQDAQSLIDEGIARVRELMDGGVPDVPEDGKAFMEWWENDIIKRNKVGLAETKRKAVKESLAKSKSSIGETGKTWSDDENIGGMLNDAGEYFLYCYFTDEQITKLPHVFEYRRKCELETYNYCKTLFVKSYGSEQDMQDIIRAGIVGRFGAQPEDVCDNICQKAGVGGGAIVLTIADIIAIISLCLSFIGGVITAICDAVAKAKVAENQSLDDEIRNSGTPNPTDYEGMDFDELLNKNTLNSFSSYLPWVAAGLGVLLLLKKSK